jgi:hypothetical protein
MINKTKNLIIILISLGLALPVFSYAYYPSIDFKANGLNTPVTVPYNTYVTLSWTATNADSCDASGDWSGTKSTSGAESMGYLTSSKTYFLNCRSSSGSAIAQMVVNIIGSSTSPTLTISKLARNIADATSYSDLIFADPSEMISFLIQITAGDSLVQNIIIKDTLPSNVVYLGNLKIDNILYTGNITFGLNIGDLSANQTKTITFDAAVAGPALFNLGDTTLINTALAYNNLVAVSDTAKIIVTKRTGGAATSVSTGLTNNLFLDSFFLPLVITLSTIWIFKSHIIKFEEWLDLRQKEYRKYRAKKLLQLKITQIKIQEFLREFKHK